MTTIRFKKLSEHATMPTKAHRDDARCDLYACLNEDMIFIPPHQTIKLDETDRDDGGFGYSGVK